MVGDFNKMHVSGGKWTNETMDNEILDIEKINWHVAKQIAGPPMQSRSLFETS